MQFEILNQLTESNHPAQLDRAGLFGDGFFSTGLICEGLLIDRELHLERIVNSANRLMFNSLDLTAINAAIDEVCALESNAILRINISRSQLKRGYAIASNASYKAQFVLSPYLKNSEVPCELFDSNTEISSNQSLAGIKHLNRLDSVLAASALKEVHHEALMYHQNDLICGSKTNLFVNIDGGWQTPSLERCGVLGIMRHKVLANMRRLGVECKIAPISRTRVKEISSAFITNCVFGVWPATSINGRALQLAPSQQLKRELFK